MRRCAALLLLQLFGTYASANDVLAAVRACTSVARDAERLACYDRALQAAGPVAPAVVSPSDTARSAPATAAVAVTHADAANAEFGLSEQARRERAGVESAAGLESTVAAVGRSATDRQVVTLANGQVWVQAEASTRVRLKAGDAVTIKRAAMGSYLLAKPNQGAMRVKRLE